MVSFSRPVAGAVATLALASLVVPVWFDAQSRSYELERQNRSPEDGGYTFEDYKGFMKIIGSDNMLDPRGNNATLAEFDRLAETPTSILEIGPGSGDFGRLLARTFPNASVVGVDEHELSLNAARSFGENPPNLHFELRSGHELADEDSSYDVITTTYVNHEIFPDDAFVAFLRRVKQVGRKAFIFNDYHRTFGCLLASKVWFKLSEHGHFLDQFALENILPIREFDRAELRRRKEVPLAQTPSALKLATDGGWQSMRRSFSLDEYARVFKQAGFPENAVKCTRHDTWKAAEWLSATCRVTCFADLTYDSAPLKTTA